MCWENPSYVSHYKNLTKTSRITRFGSCSMHDLVHDLARSILDDKISLDVPKDATCSTKSYRYFSLTKQAQNLPPKNPFQKARAIYVDKIDGDKSDDTIFGKALKNARHLHSITVKLSYEEAVPISILQVKNLKYLDISGLRSEALPEAISDIWSLQALHLTSSDLVELPKSIGKLQKLRTLSLFGCIWLECLPDSIGDCQMISNIHLCRCWKLTVLPNSIGKLQKLKTLNLSDCEELKCLPDSIGDCQMISNIDLCHCRKLAVLPNSIGKLQKLKTLNLSDCEELKCLPDSIGDCQMISSIDLSDCEELKCLPDSIGKCHMLSRIDLGYCAKLTALPNSIGTNEKLRVLRLGNTKIERLPSCITTLRNLECLDLQDCMELVELPEGTGNLEKLQVLNLKGCFSLGHMPVGIGQLSRLQKLGLFILGEDEISAQISELANIPRIGGKLTIRGISHRMDPDDAHKACLKQKTNLQELALWWDMRNDTDEASIELDQAVLDGLEPPPGIKELEIVRYSGRRYASWMLNLVGVRVQGLPYFPFLRVMKLRDFPNLKHLDGLVKLPCLEELELADMLSLESISGGPFPSLVNLAMKCLPNLGEVWMVAERTMADGEEGGGCSNCTPHLGQVRVGSCVSALDIYACPKLKIKPYLPSSLQRLVLSGSSEQMLQSRQCQGSSSSSSFSHPKMLELMQHMTAALESLKISGFYDLTELPESMRSLTSLQTDSVKHCSAIRMLPEWLGELRSLQKLTIKGCHNLRTLPQTMGDLTSLQVLQIEQRDALEQLPECLGELCSLRKLKISALAGLTCLPQSMGGLTSLEELWIEDCPGIISLPEGIKCLTALRRLQIIDCLDLERRCEEGKGEDWHLISHIPDVFIL